MALDTRPGSQIGSYNSPFGSGIARAVTVTVTEPRWRAVAWGNGGGAPRDHQRELQRADQHLQRRRHGRWRRRWRRLLPVNHGREPQALNGEDRRSRTRCCWTTTSAPRMASAPISCTASRSIWLSMLVDSSFGKRKTMMPEWRPGGKLSRLAKPRSAVTSTAPNVCARANIS